MNFLETFRNLQNFPSQSIFSLNMRNWYDYCMCDLFFFFNFQVLSPGFPDLEELSFGTSQSISDRNGDVLHRSVCVSVLKYITSPQIMFNIFYFLH